MRRLSISCDRKKDARRPSQASVANANSLTDAWFVGYGPEEAPEIVVVALFENGEHGDRAAWIVRDVLKAYFDKKARRGNLPSENAFVPRMLLHEGPLAIATPVGSLPRW